MCSITLPSAREQARDPHPEAVPLYVVAPVMLDKETNSIMGPCVSQLGTSVL